MGEAARTAHSLTSHTYKKKETAHQQWEKGLHFHPRREPRSCTDPYQHTKALTRAYQTACWKPLGFVQGEWFISHCLDLLTVSALTQPMVGVCQALCKQRSQKHPAVPPTPSVTPPSSSSGRNYQGCWQLPSKTSVRVEAVSQTCSFCLQFGAAAQHTCRKEARHSSTCHGHQGARGNEGTFWASADCSWVNPALDRRQTGLKLGTACPVVWWHSPPPWSLGVAGVLLPQVLYLSWHQFQKSSPPAGMSHTSSWTDANASSLWWLRPL